MSYHISEDGTPRECTASPGNCRIGDNSNHFSSFEEAQIHFETLNSDNLFKSIVNRVDDDEYIVDKGSNPVIELEGQTFEESEALERMYELEKIISAHQHNRSKGFSDEEQSDVIATRDSVAAFTDEMELKRAWQIQDYDKVRLLYAKAYSRFLDSGPGTFRYSPEEVVMEARKNMED